MTGVGEEAASNTAETQLSLKSRAVPNCLNFPLRCASTTTVFPEQSCEARGCIRHGNVRVWNDGRAV